MRLCESEEKVMSILWTHDTISAKQVSLIAKELFGWNKNTTYTILTKLVSKKCVLREDPGFLCTALLSMSEVKSEETSALLNKYYEGSRMALFSALISDVQLSPEEIDQLRNMIKKE